MVNKKLPPPPVNNENDTKENHLAYVPFSSEYLGYNIIEKLASQSCK